MSQIILFDEQQPQYNNLVLAKHCDFDRWGYRESANAFNYAFGGFDKEGYELCLYEKWSYMENDIILRSCLGHELAQYPWFEQNPDVETKVHLDHSLRLFRFEFNEESKEYLRERFFNKYRPIANLINIRSKFGFDIAIDYIEDDGTVTEIFHIERDFRYYSAYMELKAFWEERLVGVDWEDVGKHIVASKDKLENLSGAARANWKVNYVFGDIINSEINLHSVI